MREWIDRLNSTKLQVGYDDVELSDSPVVSPSNIPGYERDHDPNKPKAPAQEEKDMDTLVEFYAGWALVNCHLYRRFAVATHLKPCQRWSSWNHVEFKQGNEILALYGLEGERKDPKLASQNNHPCQVQAPQPVRSSTADPRVTAGDSPRSPHPPAQQLPRSSTVTDPRLTAGNVRLPPRPPAQQPRASSIATDHHLARGNSTVSHHVLPNKPPPQNPISASR